MYNGSGLKKNGTRPTCDAVRKEREIGYSEYG